MTRDPGTPGTARSDRSRRQETVTFDRAGYARLLVEVARVDGDVDGRAADLLVGDARGRCLACVGSGDVARRVRARPTGRHRRLRTGAPHGWSPYGPPKMIRPTNRAKAGTPIAASIAAEPRSSRADHGRRSPARRARVALCVMRTFQPGDDAQAEAADRHGGGGGGPVRAGGGPGQYVVSAGLGDEVVGGADAVGLAALLGAGGSGALLRGGDRDRRAW